MLIFLDSFHCSLCAAKGRDHYTLVSQVAIGFSYGWTGTQGGDCSGEVCLLRKETVSRVTSFSPIKIILLSIPSWIKSSSHKQPCLLMYILSLQLPWKGRQRNTLWQHIYKKEATFLPLGEHREFPAKRVISLPEDQSCFGTNTLKYHASPRCAIFITSVTKWMYLVRHFSMQSLAFPSKSLLDKLEFQQPVADLSPHYFFLAYESGIEHFSFNCSRHVIY